MPVDLTPLEPDGLQLHILLNSLLSGYGFFKGMSDEQKREFDGRVEKLICSYLPYED